MKCKFCNWDNPEGELECQKCRKPLQPDEPNPSPEEPSSQPPVNDHQTARQQKGAAYLKATIRESSMNKPGTAVPERKNECPTCHYELENGVCKCCGYDENEEKPEEKPEENQSDMKTEGKHTIRPIRKGEKQGRFVLTPISEETGLSEGEILVFDGNEVQLNRDNTDPKNPTITSQGQATITHEEGKWLIQDNSEFRTTFVQAARKIELKSEDLILLGNQLYRFDSLEQ